MIREPGQQNKAMFLGLPSGGRGRQNFQLPAGAAFAAWKKGTHLEGAYITGVHRAAVQEVHLNNLVGYKRVRSPEVLEVF